MTKTTISAFLGLMFSTQAMSDEPIGIVLAAQGKVEAQVNAGALRKLERKSALFQGETIKLGAQSRAQLRFSDGTLLSLAENTTFSVDTYKYGAGIDDEMRTRLERGALRALPGKIDSEKTKSLQIASPVAVMGVVGTLLSVVATQEDMVVGVFQGKAWLESDSLRLNLGRHEGFDFASQSLESNGPKGLLVQPEALSKLEFKIVLREIGDKNALAAALQEVSSVKPLSGTDLQNIKAIAQSGGRYGPQARLKIRDRQIEFRAEGIDCQ